MSTVPSRTMTGPACCYNTDLSFYDGSTCSRPVVKCEGQRQSGQAIKLFAFRHLEKLVLDSIFDTCLSSLMMWNLQSYPIQQRFWMKECDIFEGVKTYSDPSYMAGPPNLPWSTLLDTRVQGLIACVMCRGFSACHEILTAKDIGCGVGSQADVTDVIIIIDSRSFISGRQRSNNWSSTGAGVKLRGNFSNRPISSGSSKLPSPSTSIRRPFDC